jgi:signal transduction histidine kinase
LQPVLQAIVSTAVRLCQAEYALAFELRDGVYRLVATDQVDSAFAEYAEQNPIPLGQGSLTGRAGLEKRTIHLPDCLADPEYELHGHQQIGQFRTGLGVPLLHEDGPVGVITLLRTRVEPFTNRQIELVETFADQALIAIKNARLFEEVQARTRDLQEALDYQTATSEVLGVISRSTLDLQPVLEIVIESATRLCGATRGQIFRFDVERDVLLLAAAHGAWPGFVEYLEKNPTRPGPGSISGMAAAQRRTVHIPDALELEGYEHKELLRAQEFRTALAVPIQREDALLGVMVVLKSHVEPFTVRQIELVETFADQAVIAIENARLFEEVQARTSELGRSLAELRALAEVGRTVSSSLDLPTVLGAILQHACEISNTGGGAIYVLDADAGELTLEAGHNMSEELIEAVRNHRMRLGDPVVGECAQQGAPVEVPDIDLADDYPLFKVLRQSGIKALLAVPLTHQGATIGVLLVRRRRAGAFDAGTVSLLQAFASQSSIAINNARLFHEIEEKRRQIEIASQHKSQFLANMSHELRTPLNAILGYTELMQDGVYGELPEKSATVLERVQANGRHLLGLINDVLDLSKIEAGQLVLRLEDYALSDVVQTVATASEPLAREKKLDLKIEIAGDMPRGRGDERRIAQVLLNLVGNAIKFTEEGGVRVQARAKKSKFVVTVADTGPGIAASEQARIFDEFQQVDSSNTKTKGGTGLGLAISKRIIEMHGGRISVHSEPGEGAVFRVDLPIRVERQRSL